MIEQKKINTTTGLTMNQRVMEGIARCQRQLIERADNAGKLGNLKMCIGNTVNDGFDAEEAQKLYTAIDQKMAQLKLQPNRAY